MNASRTPVFPAPAFYNPVAILTVVVVVFLQLKVNRLSAQEATLSENATLAPQESSGWAIEGQLKVVHEWTATAPINGIVRELHVVEGDSIDAGQRVAKWEDRILFQEWQAALAAAKAARLEFEQDQELEYAQLAAELRRAELERGLAANRQYDRSVSKTELQKLGLMVTQSKLAIEQAQSQRSILQLTTQEKEALALIHELRFESSELKSEMEGTVTDVYVTENQWVSEGTPIARVVDLRALRFETLVDFSIAKGIEKGSKVQFKPMPQRQESSLTAFRESDLGSAESDDGDDLELVSAYEATIVFISPEINPITKQVRLHALLDNTHLELQPGLSGVLQVK